MRHFAHLGESLVGELFHRLPVEFDAGSPREMLAVALGATLYVPATRPGLATVVRRRAAEGVRSMVLDLEDAIGDHEATQALSWVVGALGELERGPAPEVLLFVRVRSPETVRVLTGAPGHAILNGFVLPKFTSEGGRGYLDEIAAASDRSGHRLYAMPVLESPEIVHGETRGAELRSIAALLARHRDRVLAVRVGATDMCGAFGIRRDRDLTIYDVRVIADVVADIVNYLGRADGSGFVITGPVWEYYADRERMFRPLLRSTPFEDHDAVRFRRHLVSHDLDGLLREIALDRANGMLGKTVIHPSHVAVVHALSAVTHEEYLDAVDVQGATEGVRASGYRNKMNETKPHRHWATRTLLRANAFGVTNEGVSFVDLLTALANR